MDLARSGTEGSDVRGELLDRTRLGVQAEAVRSDHLAERGVGGDGRVTDPVVRLDHVAYTHRVQTPPAAGSVDAGVDLQVGMTVRVTRR